MRDQFFQEPLSIATIYQLEAMHGYLYAIDKLKALAINDPEAAFRLAVVYINKNDRFNACHFFQNAIMLEKNSHSKKYTHIVNMKYSSFINAYEKFMPRYVLR